MINISNEKIRDIINFWNNIHFHPTDAIEDEWGQEFLKEISKDNVAKTVRLYAMFEDIYSLDENGNLIENYKDNDTRLDFLLKEGFNPLVCYAYMPKFLATDASLTQTNSNKKLRYKGKVIITSEPKDYDVWEDLCYRYTKHIVDRYGEKEVSKWRLQCWNEPDLHNFFFSNLDMSDESVSIREKAYFKLYKKFASGVLRVSNDLLIGGPSQGADWNFNFINDFLRDVKENDIRIDFISIHIYGVFPPKVESGEEPLSFNNNIRKYNNVINEIYKYYTDKEIIMDEWGAAGWGFVNAKQSPTLIFRENSVFPTYFAKMVTRFVNMNANLSKMLLCLSGQHELTNEFTGFRGLFTLNHIKKPIYNGFVLMSKLKNELLKSNVDNEYVDVLATKEKDNYAVLVSYSPENFDKNLEDLNDEITLDDVNGTYNVNVYVIDEKHTNPYLSSLEKDLSIDELKEIGNMKPVFTKTVTCGGEYKLPISLTNNGVLLLEMVKVK